MKLLSITGSAIRTCALYLYGVERHESSLALRHQVRRCAIVRISPNPFCSHLRIYAPQYRGVGIPKVRE
jgi:hypothetical protein